MFGIDDALLGAIGGGLISTAGQLYTNRQNIKEQRRVNDTNWQIAALNNATQIDMANSAHRREVADLKAAGLNPILSAGGSGLSTPSLATTPGHAASIDNPFEGLANSAKTVGKILGEQYQAELEKAKSDASISRSASEIAKQDSRNAYLDSEIHGLENILKYSALKDLAWRSVGDDMEVLDKSSDYYKEYKDGLMSNAKMQANENLRAWIDQGLRGVSSAADIYSKAKGLNLSSGRLDFDKQRWLYSILFPSKPRRP